MSTSHAGTYWLVNDWDGTYWSITSNHGSPAKVGYATNSGTASGLNIASGAGAGKVLVSDGSGNGSWATLSGGIAEIEIKPDSMFLDTTDTGSNTSSMFGIMDSIDFAPAVQGSAWLNFQFPSNWSVSKNINFKLIFSCNGNDPSKTCTVNTSWWVVNEGATPAVGSPTGTATDSISTSSTNISKLTSLVLTNGKVASGSLSANARKIAVKVTRPSTDTYTGTLQLQSILFYQS
jgi:hypothetical protein